MNKAWGEITEEKEVDVTPETSVLFTNSYTCLRDGQGVGEMTEEKEVNVMSETSVIFTNRR
jgi:hypothetical protein